MNESQKIYQRKLVTKKVVFTKQTMKLLENWQKLHGENANFAGWVKAKMFEELLATHSIT